MEEETFCRICFDTARPGKELFFPCKCTGSMKFVHEECLQKWFKSKNAGESVRCILCEQTFCFKKIYGYDGEKCSRLLWKYLCTWAEWLGSVAVLVAIAAVEFILLPWFCWWRVKLEMQNVATSSLLPVQVKLFPSSSVEGWYYWFSGFTVLTFMVFVGRMLYITGRTYFLYLRNMSLLYNFVARRKLTERVRLGLEDLRSLQVACYHTPKPMKATAHQAMLNRQRDCIENLEKAIPDLNDNSIGIELQKATQVYFAQRSDPVEPPDLNETITLSTEQQSMGVQSAQRAAVHADNKLELQLPSHTQAVHRDIEGSEEQMAPNPLPPVPPASNANTSIAGTALLGEGAAPRADQAVDAGSEAVVEGVVPPEGQEPVANATESACVLLFILVWPVFPVLAFLAITTSLWLGRLLLPNAMLTTMVESAVRLLLFHPSVPVALLDICDLGSGATWQRSDHLAQLWLLLTNLLTQGSYMFAGHAVFAILLGVACAAVAGEVLHSARVGDVGISKWTAFYYDGAPFLWNTVIVCAYPLYFAVLCPAGMVLSVVVALRSNHAHPSEAPLSVGSSGAVMLFVAALMFLLHVATVGSQLSKYVKPPFHRVLLLDRIGPGFQGIGGFLREFLLVTTFIVQMFLACVILPIRFGHLVSVPPVLVMASRLVVDNSAFERSYGETAIAVGYFSMMMCSVIYDIPYDSVVYTAVRKLLQWAVPCLRLSRLLRTSTAGSDTPPQPETYCDAWYNLLLFLCARFTCFVALFLLLNFLVCSWLLHVPLYVGRLAATCITHWFPTSQLADGKVLLHYGNGALLCKGIIQVAYLFYRDLPVECTASVALGACYKWSWKSLQAAGLILLMYSFPVLLISFAAHAIDRLQNGANTTRIFDLEAWWRYGFFGWRILLCLCFAGWLGTPGLRGVLEVVFLRGYLRVPAGRCLRCLVLPLYQMLLDRIAVPYFLAHCACMLLPLSYSYQQRAQLLRFSYLVYFVAQVAWWSICKIGKVCYVTYDVLFVVERQLVNCEQ